MGDLLEWGLLCSLGILMIVVGEVASMRRAFKAQLAELAGWEDVPDGVYGTFDTITIKENGTFLEIHSAYGDGSRRSHAMLPLPAGWRLQRRIEEGDDE